MNYPIPTTTEEIIALNKQPVDEEIVAAAIAGVIQIARSQGQTLNDLTLQVLAEDNLLDQGQRRWLSNIVTQAWKSIL
ncbi:MAG: hypothetical protein DSM107014_07400 [Gomphosphaeria aponina SAG 52.96 = DSM 107014]|uniref:Uncharacterized protein n=1 Tax=Gomphosphaeria aponina SAG 52.96 = DSM 107014 TaxID=1521640 RepID=A0A941GQK5_9CHRO|nr:hypothetical protein [Gomphosphaeria aponina SAG 52.96 = DSM 107014]